MSTDTITIADVERHCRTFAEARQVLSDRVSELQAGLDALKREKLRGIKAALAKAAAEEGALREVVKEGVDLFVKPKTQIFHGVKVGYQKGKGKLDWEDDQVLIAKIKKHYPKDEWENLINTKETPSKQGLNDLDVADLRKLGVTVDETGDVVVCKAVDGEVDKMVNALLKGAVEEAME